MNKLEELLTGTPWSRLVHWYGRATDFPAQVDNLLKNTDEKSTYKDISNNIEHQDGVFQASPFMVQVLIELLKEPNTDKEEIATILLKVFQAAVFQMDGPLPEGDEIPLDDDLWPEFENEDTDEGIWEEFMADNFYYWQKNALRIILDAKELIASLNNDKAKELTNNIDKYLA